MVCEYVCARERERDCECIVLECVLRCMCTYVFVFL